MVKRGRGRKRKARQDPVVDEEQNDSVAAAKNNTTDSQEAKTAASLKDDSDDQKATAASCSHHANVETKPVEELHTDAASGDKHEKASNGDGSMKDESNEYSKIRKCIVENDGKEENLVRLIGLKNLFSKQLPKMPRDYIVRLVFDRRHKSLAILSDDPNVQGTDDEIIGGICYRSYPEMKFAEIAFCAVSQTQQVKVSEILQILYWIDCAVSCCFGLLHISFHLMTATFAIFILKGIWNKANELTQDARHHGRR